MIACTACSRPIPADMKNGPLGNVACACGAVGNWERKVDSAGKLAASVRDLAVQSGLPALQVFDVLSILAEEFKEQAEQEEGK